MGIWISLVLAALICGYGIYKLFRGAPEESGDVSQTSDDGAPAVVSSVTADTSDDELPKQLVSPGG